MVLSANERELKKKAIKAKVDAYKAKKPAASGSMEPGPDVEEEESVE